MSADLLRRAAQVARDTAQAATEQRPDLWSVGAAASVTSPRPGGYDYVASTTAGLEVAAHIALWNPQVALAVADWLDDTAEEIAADNIVTDTRAEAVARALLVGKESAPRLDLTQYWSDGTPAAPSKKGSDHE